MTEHTTTLDAIAAQIRSKNAGPFWMTLDVFFTSDGEYRWVLESGVMPPAAIGDLYQVDPARSNKGAGLGLSIARWIVGQHHGTIAARNNNGPGTTFSVTLPLAS